MGLAPTLLQPQGSALVSGCGCAPCCDPRQVPQHSAPSSAPSSASTWAGLSLDLNLGPAASTKKDEPVRPLQLSSGSTMAAPSPYAAMGYPQRAPPPQCSVR